jgi:hypothetical protein
MAAADTKSDALNTRSVMEKPFGKKSDIGKKSDWGWRVSE